MQHKEKGDQGDEGTATCSASNSLRVSSHATPTNSSKNPPATSSPAKRPKSPIAALSINSTPPRFRSMTPRISSGSSSSSAPFVNRRALMWFEKKVMDERRLAIHSVATNPSPVPVPPVPTPRDELLRKEDLVGENCERVKNVERVGVSRRLSGGRTEPFEEPGGVTAGVATDEMPSRSERASSVSSAWRSS